MNIKIIGAKEHNLKNVTLSIPRNELVVITGVSGSGKSSLAFDTIFAEAQRDYLESLSTYARKSLPRISPTNVDSIEGLSPCIVIDQRPLARNPRSTVGTVTEIYTFLRLLYSRLGQPILRAGDFSFNNPSGACQSCKGLGVELLPDLDRLIDWHKSLSDGAILHRTWKVGGRYWNIINAIDFFDMKKPLKDFTRDELNTLLYSEPVQYQNETPGYVQSFSFEGVVKRLNKRQGDSRGLEGNSYDTQFFCLDSCSECKGARINARARSVKVRERSIVDLVTMEIKDLIPYISTLDGAIADSITPYMTKLLEYLNNIGLGYLTLSRSVATLSNGESQRLKLARQLGSSLTEIIYILDEPTAGLHARDVSHLIDVLKKLVSKPNTVIVVEHDRDVMLHAGVIVDIGPGAGIHGGKVVAQGTPEEIIQNNSITGSYLAAKKHIQVRKVRNHANGYIQIQNAKLHNLKNIDVNIPKNVLTCITGVSGSGKSSLIEVILKKYSHIIVVDQTSVGKSPRSNPATYVKAFDDIRKEFANATGQNESMFTFNGKGACEECDGLGYTIMDMHFLGDVKQVCEECKGKRYNSKTLEYMYKGKNIADILIMTAEEARKFFVNPKIKRCLQLLSEVGLEYLQLGQPLSTLSGGEAQRVKLASRLSQKGNMYILDEPTRGLHFADIDCLLALLQKLVDKGNTVIIVEHNLDIIKNADWIIDLGPNGGKDGGEIIAEGPPELIVKSTHSYTGKYLSRELNIQ
ncbi:MAG: excinuclease ABC subunit UvrA [Deferribacteres bacterium]|nr:excinuclease ABC subunit UvrA [candidate division KSB1 bacterium]MCB9501359.1 excinuclease ABC subunit UvrA [Deferribacteres bacterium]